MIQTNEVQQLLRHIHIRFEQKFKDYRMAFRHFDMNFDGQIEFEEFVQGLEFCGIAMALEEYRKVFKLINFDNAPFINFQKFCLINVDKSNNIFRLIEETKKSN
jgi:Ca2+-binding EF-hand superfamily protein